MMEKIIKVINNNILILKNFSYLSFVQVLAILMPLIYYPYLIRVLGSETYGKVLYAQAIIGFLSIFIQFGFSISATKNAATIDNDKIEMSQLFSVVFYLKLILLLLSFLILNSVVYIFEFEMITTGLLFIFFLTCIGDVFLVQWYYQGRQMMKFVALSTLISRFLAMVGIFIFVNKETDYYILAFILSLSSLFGNLVMFINVFLNCKIKFCKVNKSLLISTFKESFTFFLSRLSVVLVDKINIVIIGYFIGNSAISIYDLASKMTALLQLPFNMLNQAFYPNIAKTKNTAKVFLLIKWLLPFSIFIYMISIYLSDWFVLFYAGEDMLYSSYIFAFLGIIVPINVISHFFGNCILVVHNFSKEFNLSIIFAFVLYLLSILFLSVLNMTTLWSFTISIIMFNVCVAVLRFYYSFQKGMFFIKSEDV
ncbi:oligosaccharide flippase family protein [Aliivibrio fischeri]|uniref:oligosaccharide flippase family protein n=1 Tax=Aliivibrio fischeri TaxID=668 RepID=UPI00354D62CD